MKSLFRKIRFTRVPVILFLTVLLWLPGSAFAETQNTDQARIDEVFQLLSQNHVSAPAASQLSEAAIQGMVDSLNDPYTQYFSAEEWAQFEDALNRQYVGIGVQMDQEADGLFISRVYADSPAAEAGLQTGDKITEVGGKAIADLPYDQIYGLIAGGENTMVGLTYERAGAQKTVSVTRRTVSLPVVETKRFTDGTGYIRLASFSEDAGAKFTAGLDDLESRGIHALILDLRDNPGGLLTTAQDIAKHFIQEGILMHTKDRDGTETPIPITDGAAFPYPVYVLVNGNSASASEILSGVLQDYKIATIIGTQTFGKGSVQTIYPLQNGGVLKVTIDEYQTPSYHQVNKVGITPDIKIAGELPQLFTALWAAGAKNIAVTHTPYTLTINGAEFAESFPVLQDGGHTYAPLRTLAGLIGAQVTWDSVQRAAVLTTAGGAVRFPVGTAETRLVDETSFVDLQNFSRAYPELDWSQKGGALTLTVKKGN